MHTKVNLVILLFIASTNLFGFYPEVTSKNSDKLYKQLTVDIKENKKRLLQKKNIIPVRFYTYIINDYENIFTVSARFNLNYDTIASLNNIENQLFFIGMKTIILPTCQGLYVKEDIYENSLPLEINGEKYFFYPGKSFTGQQRLSFLITPFNSPLKNMIVTSEFGNRENPFTFNNEFHSGLDMRANTGTKIYSPYRGEINNVGYSEFYGNYLIILHPNGYSTHYYHLKEISAKVGDSINKGEYVALTGNSGKSTGPHLHFEIHLNGEPINPRILLGDV